MSADGSITMEWGDGEHRFRLAIGQLRELQEFVNKPRVAMGAPQIGPMGLWRALADNDAWPHEAREVLRLGLIGGGMTPLDALAMVKRYVDERPYFEAMRPAFMVLAAATAGVPDDTVGKQPVETTQTQTTASSSPPSTASAVH